MPSSDDTGRASLRRALARAPPGHRAVLSEHVQCVTLADAERPRGRERDLVQELGQLHGAQTLVRCEGSYTDKASGAVQAATRIVEVYAEHGDRLAAAPIAELAALTGLDGTPLARTLWSQALTRLVIAAANERRWASRSFDGVERMLIEGDDPFCSHAQLSIEGSRGVPGAGFTLSVLTRPSWTGEPWALTGRGRFEL